MDRVGSVINTLHNLGQAWVIIDEECLILGCGGAALIRTVMSSSVQFTAARGSDGIGLV